MLENVAVYAGLLVPAAGATWAIWWQFHTSAAVTSAMAALLLSLGPLPPRRVGRAMLVGLAVASVISTAALFSLLFGEPRQPWGEFAVFAAGGLLAHSLCAGVGRTRRFGAR